MATYQFSSLTHLQHLAFDPAVDTIAFDQPATALAVEAFGDGLRLVLGTKTVFLDGLALESLRSAAFTFPSGSMLRYGDASAGALRDWYGTSLSFSDPSVAVHAAGLGGADNLTTSAGNDVLVGNGPLVKLAQVSTAGGVGSPNASSDVSISADGRFVAFYGGWTGFGSQSNSGTDVFVKDMLTGTVVNEHKSANGDFGLSGSGAPEISADGKWLVFWSASALSPTRRARRSSRQRPPGRESPRCRPRQAVRSPTAHRTTPTSRPTGAGSSSRAGRRTSPLAETRATTTSSSRTPSPAPSGARRQPRRRRRQRRLPRPEDLRRRPLRRLQQLRNQPDADRRLDPRRPVPVGPQHAEAHQRHRRQGRRLRRARRRRRRRRQHRRRGRL